MALQGSGTSFVSPGRAVKLLLGGWDVLEGRRAPVPVTLYSRITDYFFYFVTFFFYFVSPSQLLGVAPVSAEHASLPVSLWKGTKASKAPGGSLRATVGDERTAEFAIWRDRGLPASCRRVCSCQCSLNYTLCFQ